MQKQGPFIHSVSGKGEFAFISLSHPINQLLIVNVDLNQAAEAAL